MNMYKKYRIHLRAFKKQLSILGNADSFAVVYISKTQCK